jgi:uncharacterized cupin superfamily protein
MAADKPFLIKADSTREMDEHRASHPLNPKAEAHYRSLSGVVGLQRLGLHMVRLAPGKEANAYHTHRFEEEFYYVLSGQGVALVDGKEHEIGPGDFLGFPTPSLAHLLKNTSDEDLVYLVGGERKSFEFADYPSLGKHLLRDGKRIWLVDSDRLEEWDWRKK